jgi:hypothetical protein
MRESHRIQDMPTPIATSLEGDLGLPGSNSWLEVIDWDNVVWLILTFTVPEQALLTEGVAWPG